MPLVTIQLLQTQDRLPPRSGEGDREGEVAPCHPFFPAPLGPLIVLRSPDPAIKKGPSAYLALSFAKSRVRNPIKLNQMPVCPMSVSAPPIATRPIPVYDMLYYPKHRVGAVILPHP